MICLRIVTCVLYLIIIVSSTQFFMKIVRIRKFPWSLFLHFQGVTSVTYGYEQFQKSVWQPCIRFISQCIILSIQVKYFFLSFSHHTVIKIYYKKVLWDHIVILDHSDKFKNCIKYVSPLVSHANSPPPSVFQWFLK